MIIKYLVIIVIIISTLPFFIHESRVVEVCGLDLSSKFEEPYGSL